MSSAKRNCTAQPPRGAELDPCSDGWARGCRRGGCRMPTLPVMICPPSSFRGLGTAHPCHALPGGRRAVYAPPCSRADDGLPLRSQSRRTLQRQLSLFGMPLLPRIPVTYAFVPLPAHLTIVLRAAIMLTLLNVTTARPSAAFSQGTAAGRLQAPTRILRQVSRAQVLPATRRAILTSRPRTLIFGHGHRIATGHFTAIIVWC